MNTQPINSIQVLTATLAVLIESNDRGCISQPRESGAQLNKNRIIEEVLLKYAVSLADVSAGINYRGCKPFQ